MQIIYSKVVGAEPCTVIDTETIGLDAQDDSCRIIEIAAVKYIKGVEIARLNTQICPELVFYVLEQITAINKISSDMLNSGDVPTFADVVELLRALVKDAVVVWHNLSFDSRNHIYEK